jgi:serine/threonine protein phosphatase PrpC
VSEPIRLSGSDGSAAPGDNNGNRPRGGVLSACRERADKALAGLLKGMFERADDALFELADKSVNNAEQTRYFDAMRELRLKRATLERRFGEACARHFVPRVALPPTPVPVPAAGENASNLSLVANDDLEETLAVGTMVAKIESACAEELYALDQRMAKLLDRIPEGDEPVNPLAPRWLCEAFRDACDQLDATIEVKLLVLKLFDKYVGSGLAEFYRGINAFLANEGILPQVRGRAVGAPIASRGTARRPRGQNRPGAEGGLPGEVPAPGGGYPAASAAAGCWNAAAPGYGPGYGGVAGGGFGPAEGAAAGFFADDLAGGDFATLSGVPAQQLLATLQSVMTAQGARALGEEAATGGSLADTLDLLNRLQHAAPGAGAGEAGEGAVDDPIDPARLTAGTTNILRELKQTTVLGAVGQVDSMMIDIVAMLFDSILDDPAIAAPMKSLIGRLQIPVLKVAILDKTFFARKFHPARQLLNGLADVALGAAEDAGPDDPLYAAVDAVVHRILDEFDDDVRVFKDALADLDAYRASEQREAATRVEQTLEELQAQERLRFARQVAGDAVAPNLREPALPVIVREFLDVYWKSYLQLAYIEGGDESAAWAQGIATMEDLVWSLSPRHEPVERERLKQLLPTLPARLKDGMSRVPVPDSFRDRFMAALVRLHLAAIRGAAAAGVAEEIADPPAATATKPYGAAIDDVDAAPPPPELGAHAEFFDPTGAVAATTAAHGTDDPTSGGEADDESAVVDDDAARLVRAFDGANRAIFDTARARAECEGMGTTLVAARFVGDRVTMAHVGDSRLYRLREGELTQLTRDHSLRQQLVDQGFLTPEEARVSTRKNYITRAVGIDASVDTDTAVETVMPGDLFLLCSDGLCDMVEDADLASILAAHSGELEAAAGALVAQANTAGGKDNISVILVAAPDPLPDGAEEPRGWRMAALSDVGRTRSHNEDAVGCDAVAGVAVLADGMGGYNAGEVASALAIEAVMRALDATLPVGVALSGEDLETTERTQPEDGFPSIDTMLFGEVDDPARTQAEAREHGARTLPGDIVTGAADVEEIEITDSGLGGAGTEEDEHMRAARALKIGSWVEFTHDPGKTVRARLTWVSAVTGGYLFTNRKGLRVADTTPQGLAVEFRRGTARPLETVPLFDRAVSSLMDRLHGGDQGDPWG